MKRMSLIVGVCALLLGAAAGCVSASPGVEATLEPSPTPLIVEATVTPTAEAATATTEMQPSPTSPTAATLTPTIQASPTVTGTAVSGGVEQPTVGWQADGIVTEGEYAHTTEAAGVTFDWRNDDEFLYGALSSETTGWVAVGFDPQNLMQGANFIIGDVSEGGELTIEDQYGTEPTTAHPSDVTLGGVDNIEQSAGQEAQGMTTIEFKIPLDSGDEFDKPLRSGETYRIMLARGETDDIEQYHTERGYSEITID